MASRRIVLQPFTERRRRQTSMLEVPKRRVLKCQRKGRRNQSRVEHQDSERHEGHLLMCHWSSRLQGERDHCDRSLQCDELVIDRMALIHSSKSCPCFIKWKRLVVLKPFQPGLGCLFRHRNLTMEKQVNQGLDFLETLISHLSLINLSFKVCESSDLNLALLYTTSTTTLGALTPLRNCFEGLLNNINTDHNRLLRKLGKVYPLSRLKRNIAKLETMER